MKGLGDINQSGAIRLHGDYVLAVKPGSDSVAVLRVLPPEGSALELSSQAAFAARVET